MWTVDAGEGCILIDATEGEDFDIDTESESSERGYLLPGSKMHTGMKPRCNAQSSTSRSLRVHCCQNERRTRPPRLPGTIGKKIKAQACQDVSLISEMFIGFHHFKAPASPSRGAVGAHSPMVTAPCPLDRFHDVSRLLGPHHHGRCRTVREH
jgi:hypothetical protein